MEKFNEIESKLNELVVLISENEYTSFVEQDGVMKIYDAALELEDGYLYLSDKALTEVLDLVTAKLEAVKNA